MNLLHVSTARRGIRWARVSLAVLALVPLAVAACGGSRSPGVAKLTTTEATTPAAASGTSIERYAACMRSHGLPQFPDPTDGGKHFQLRVGPGGINKDSPQFRSALASCAGLEPPGLNINGPIITPAEQVDYLKAAACMRAHGVPNFPDPTFVGGHVSFNFPAGLTPNSPHVAAALVICRKLIPAGLPGSGTG